MTIAVHIRFPDTTTDPVNDFHYQSFLILAARHPEHHFIFIFDKPYPAGLAIQENIKTLLLPPQIRNLLLLHYWYNFKLPRLLDKYNVDHFVSNAAVCSLRTDIPQSILLHDLSFLDKKNLYAANERRYLKKYLKRFVAKASAVVVTNQYVGNVLTGIYPGAIDKMILTGHGMKSNITPVQSQEVQNTKNEYSAGKEYFLAFITDATIENIILLLKAFSAFKKRQLSNMQLILLVSSTQKEGIVKDFANYKYRDDVKILIPENAEVEKRIVAAAYAAVYLPAINIHEEKGLLALSNGVPLITSDHEFCKSTFHGSALYSSADERSLAEKIMLLYKDENLRNDLLHAGRSIAAANTWENTAGKLGFSLLNTATQTA